MTLGLGGFVFLIFLFLKLAAIGAVASWSWWWVTAPLWIGFVAWAVLMVVGFAIAVIVMV
ncbi:hypothetical protein G5S35_17670 [Paraburkholderia tropica]|uniref:hypothetical protein n=1 Tax=Paraburkholderia tropica TaxID=92647 RepID=UPI001601A4FB|nr:hypothetical protein [Paraburkholderia tropica]QNB13457.1 hypothetical protein G5S35_17670 [Paraburkholderia tropica]